MKTPLSFTQSILDSPKFFSYLQMSKMAITDTTFLRKNSEYVLNSSSAGSDPSNKSLFLVKLTDSSERALENFFKNHKRLDRRPMINFESATGGRISIPSENQKGKDEDDDVFFFSIATETNRKCSEINVETPSTALSPLGVAKLKLTIHATNETFSQTREKMALIEDANKQQQAKEIRPGLKGKRGKQMVETKAFSAKPTKASFVSSAPKPSSSSSGSRGNPPSTSTKLESGIRLKPKPEPCLPPKQPTPPPRSQDSNSAANSTPTAVILSGRGLRERVVHLLALRPYKKVELILRLRNDGFSLPKGDPDPFVELLNEVGNVLQKGTKASSYMLKKELYKEVNRDWESYSEEDKKLLTKQIHHFEGGSAATTAASAPADSSRSLSTPSSLKRPPSISPPDEAGAPPYSKKQRIAHKPKVASLQEASPSENRNVSPLPPSESAPSTVVPSSSGKQNNAPGRSFGTSFKTAPLPNALKHPKLLGTTPLGPTTGNPSAVKNSRPFAESSNQKARESGHEEARATDTDYVVKYQKILSDDQEKQYARDFDQEYKEYSELLEHITKTAKHAQILDQELENTKEGTSEHEDAKKNLLDFHKEFIKKGDRQRKQRLTYLAQKLSHIKRLIFDYNERKKLNNSNNNVDFPSNSPENGATAHA